MLSIQSLIMIALFIIVVQVVCKKSSYIKSFSLKKSILICFTMIFSSIAATILINDLYFLIIITSISGAILIQNTYLEQIPKQF